MLFLIHKIAKNELKKYSYYFQELPRAQSRVGALKGAALKAFCIALCTFLNYIGDISGGLLIDVGSGPTLYQVLSGCEVFKLEGWSLTSSPSMCIVLSQWPQMPSRPANAEHQAESGSPDLDTFTKALGHISKLLRPGGQLLLIGALQESFYFGVCASLQEQGFTLIRLEVYTLPRYMWGTDDTNNGRWCFFVKAKED
uniref:Phenylethanolamine N-methyltransferase n=1 Tax=Neogobius melanostomus TaxID=47308 RepID=A0A8C6TKP2_9GOBI